MNDDPQATPDPEADDERTPPPPPSLEAKEGTATPTHAATHEAADLPADDLPVVPGGAEWLDPENRRRRHQRRPPRGPVDRLRRRWRRWRRHRRAVAKRAHWYRPRNVVVGLIALLILGLLATMLAAYIKISGIRRVALLPTTVATASVGTNILLLGSNGPEGALVLDPHTLVVQFIHIGANYQAGQVIDLPRDLVIGTGKAAATVETTYLRKGVVGLVGTLQAGMGLTIDHVIQASYRGYAQVSDDLGGVTIKTDTGPRFFTGTQAQAYAAEPDPPGHTIETGQRYQHWSKAMLEATLRPGVLFDPFTLWSVFSHTADNILVDDTLNNTALVELLWHVKSLRPGELHFFTAPNGGYGKLHGQHVLLPNPAGFSQLSTAIRTDNLATIGLFQ